MLMKTNTKSVEYRDKARRIDERRRYTRRLVTAAFGSDKWVEAIQSNYVLWPKQDRRSSERRNVDRRWAERRSQLRAYRRKAFRQRIMDKQMPSHTLTTEERNMLNDLYNRP